MEIMILVLIFGAICSVAGWQSGFHAGFYMRGRVEDKATTWEAEWDDTDDDEP
jgi:hypothetical protein